MFKSGETWKGYFKLRGSGSQDKPIVIESYSSGINLKLMVMDIRQLFLLKIKNMLLLVVWS